MMKNKFLFLVLLGFVMLSSCSDDDKNLFDNYSENYSASKLDLTFNGKKLNDKSISVNSLNKENVSLALKNMIPGEDSLVIANLAVLELGNDDFSFVGENKNNDRTIAVEGAIRSKVLTLNTNFKVTSKVVGSWKLAKMLEDVSMDEMANSSPLYFELQTNAVKEVTLPIMLFGERYDENGKPIYDLPWVVPMESNEEEGEVGFAHFVSNLGGQILPQFLYSIELKENGDLIASYGDGGETPLTSEEGLVRYNVKDDQIYLLIDIASLMSRSTQSQPNIEKMLTSGIPLKLELSNDQLKAYVDKDMMVPFMTFMPVVKELIKGMEPINAFIGEITEETLSKFLDEVVVLVMTADKMNLGLKLVPDKGEESIPTPESFSVSLKRGLEKFAK